MAARPKKIQAQDIIGAHPTHGCVFADCFDAIDCYTTARVPHRVLARTSEEQAMIEPLRQMLTKHHASEAKLKRVETMRQILTKRGRHSTVKGLRLFPTNVNTRKGNLAESLLSEYVDATGKAETLVYRLRHNPNIDQSMKGDDLLAFHFEKAISGIVVGEANFARMRTRWWSLQFAKRFNGRSRAVCRCLCNLSQTEFSKPAMQY